jgi:hypothetical protein
MGFADLMVAVAWMIVIAAYFFDRLGLGRGCAGKDIGRLIEDVVGLGDFFTDMATGARPPDGGVFYIRGGRATAAAKRR